MYDFDTHTRQLAELEASVREARERNVTLPKTSTRIISVLVAFVIAATVFVTGVV